MFRVSPLRPLRDSDRREAGVPRRARFPRRAACQVPCACCDSHCRQHALSPSPGASAWITRRSIYMAGSRQQKTYLTPQHDPEPGAIPSVGFALGLLRQFATEYCAVRSHRAEPPARRPLRRRSPRRSSRHPWPPAGPTPWLRAATWGSHPCPAQAVFPLRCHRNSPAAPSARVAAHR
jgi:hypothetical protein